MYWIFRIFASNFRCKDTTFFDEQQQNSEKDSQHRLPIRAWRRYFVVDVPRYRLQGNGRNSAPRDGLGVDAFFVGVWSDSPDVSWHQMETDLGAIGRASTHD